MKKYVWYYIFNNVFLKMKKYNCVFGMYIYIYFNESDNI